MLCFKNEELKKFSGQIRERKSKHYLKLWHMNLPQHIPHNPVKTVSSITSSKSPFCVKPKIAKAKINTLAVCPNITVN